MATNFLGDTESDITTTAPDYLGVESPVAFSGKAALPAGGPIVGGAAPATEGGTGVVSSVPDGLGGGPGGDQGGGPTSPGALQRIQQALKAIGVGKDVVDQFGFGGGESGVPIGEAGGERGQIATADPNFDSAMSGFMGSISSDAARGTVATADPNFDANMGDFSQNIAPADAATSDAGNILGSDAAAGAGVGAASAALALIMQYIAAETGNADVGRAGTAAGAVGGVGGAALAGSPLIAFAPATLGYAGMSIAKSIDEEQRIKSDIASAKELIGQKVPSALQGLEQGVEAYNALGDISSAPTDALVATMGNLEAARSAFNQVDHAFKGGVTVAGKGIDTGLPEMSMLAPLDPNLPQLRIQDELARRGYDTTTLPGYRTANQWLSGASQPAMDQWAPPGLHTEFDLETGNAIQIGSARPWENLSEPYGALVGAIQPGNIEQGLYDLLQMFNMPQSGIPGFGQGLPRVAQRSGDPGAPRGGDPGAPARPDTKALEQLAAFGLLPGGGAAKGEELLES